MLQGLFGQNKQQNALLWTRRKWLRNPMEQWTCYDSIYKIVVTRWNENSFVTLASNCQAVNAIGKAKRFSRKEKKMIEVNEPYAVRYYNQNMGRVGYMDQNISFNRVPAHAKKWWMSLFMFMPDSAMQNAWLLYRQSDASKSIPLDLLGFRKEVVGIYCQKHLSWQSGVGSVGHPVLVTSRKLVHLSEPVRIDEQGHYRASNLTQRRCAYCGMKFKFILGKWNIGLPIDCFFAYHNKQ